MNAEVLKWVGWALAWISGMFFGFLIKSAVEAHIEAAAHKIAAERIRQKELGNDRI